MEFLATITDEQHDAIHDAVEDVLSDLGEAISYRVEKIEHVAYDGFIPFTNGGWNGVATFALHSEEGRNKVIRPMQESDEQDCIDEFKREQEIPDDADLFEFLELHESLREKWDDFAMEWECTDINTWFVYMRVLYFDATNHRNETGGDEVLFCIGINDDVNYGRDSISWSPGVGTTWLWERTVPVAEITDELLEEIKTEALQAWTESFR